MNKTELIDLVAQKTSLKKKDAEEAVSAVFDSIQASLAKGEKVQIIGFGSFDVKKVSAKEGRNPKTGETIKIAACNRPVFAAGKGLKEIVNK